MIIPFYKMTGAGNDFVMVDNRDLALSHLLTGENIARLCNRRFGIGADGLIAVEPSQNMADVRMRYYNAAQYLETFKKAFAADALASQVCES